VLFALEFVGAVAVADGDGERIAAGFLDEFDGFVRVGVMAAGGMGAAFFAFVELRADQVAEFGFDGAIEFVGVFHDLAGDFDVLLERLVAGVNHHAGETFVNALFAQLEGVAVVQVDGDGDVGQADRRLDEFLEIDRVGVLAGALGNLEDQRRFFLFAGLNDGLDEFHVVDVERAERVFALQRLRKQFFGMCQWHKFSNLIVLSTNRDFPMGKE
jgi:hypothetical protein